MITWIRTALLYTPQPPLPPDLPEVECPLDLSCSIGGDGIPMKDPVEVIHELPLTSRGTQAPQSLSKRIMSWFCAQVCTKKELASISGPAPKDTPPPVSHVFERRHIQQWAEGNPTCPICRVKIKPNQFIEAIKVKEAIAAFYIENPQLLPCPEFTTIRPEDFEVFLSRQRLFDQAYVQKEEVRKGVFKEVRYKGSGIDKIVRKGLISSFTPTATIDSHYQVVIKITPDKSEGKVTVIRERWFSRLFMRGLFNRH